jgi:adenylate kinase family enzyme
MENNTNAASPILGTITKYNYPPVFIVGDSGSGKSTSIRNLPKNSTRILNIEKKILPFKEALQFNSLMLDTHFQVEDEFDKAVADDNVKTIIIESFTRYSDALIANCRMADKTWGAYNMYSDRMLSFFQNKLFKAQNKQIFLTAIPELVEQYDAMGAKKTPRRIGVAGKKLEGMIESYFTVVLFTEVKYDPVAKKSVYQFLTNNDGTFSAKSPDGMFTGPVANDLKIVSEKVWEYYGLPKLV